MRIIANRRVVYNFKDDLANSLSIVAHCSCSIRFHDIKGCVCKILIVHVEERMHHRKYDRLRGAVFNLVPCIGLPLCAHGLYSHGAQRVGTAQ